MKLLIVTCDGNAGGGSNHVLQLLRGLSERFKCSLLTQKGSYLSNGASDAGIKVYEGEFFKGRLNPKSIWVIRETVKKMQPDLIHCHGGRAAFFFRYTGIRCPSVYTVHGLHYPRKRFIYRVAGRQAEKVNVSHSDHVIFVSDYDCKLAKEEGIIDSRNTWSIIKNAVPAPSVSVSSKGFCVGFVGRFVEQKDPLSFVKMMSLLPDRSAVMVGGGPLEGEVRKAIAKHKMGERITLVGEANHDVALEYIAKIQVLVITSKWEGFPLLPIEAMHLSVPVVSTPVGGVTEIINGNDTGLIGDTPEKLADCVSRLLVEPVLYNRISKTAGEIVRTEFSEMDMLRAIEQVYVSLGKSMFVDRE